jgi:hypothetical protein
MRQRYCDRLPAVRPTLTAGAHRGCIGSHRAISHKESDVKARNTLIATLAAGIAVLAPATAVASPHDLPLGAGTTATQQVRPDDRAGARGAADLVTANTAAARPDDRAGNRGPGAPIRPSVVDTSNGFDWRDALIGGLTGVGIALMLMGALFLVTGRRTRARVA